MMSDNGENQAIDKKEEQEQENDSTKGSCGCGCVPPIETKQRKKCSGEGESSRSIHPLNLLLGGRMKEMLLAIVTWLHLIATVLWIGGIAFILFIAMPAAKQIMGLEAGKLMGVISKRFTLLANYSIALLVLTGAAMAVLNNKFSSTAILENNWFIILAAKHILVFTIIVIHFYRADSTPKCNTRSF